jgi:hypothetical protein
MPSHILDGLSIVDPTGRLILVAIAACLVLSVGVNLRVRARYRALESDLDENGAPQRGFLHDVLNQIVKAARQAARSSPEPNVQAIVEAHFQSALKPLLLGERFVRAATGLVLILGLMGTFYGLTLSIGRLVHLVGGDAGAASDAAQAVTGGLTQALSGMAAAFSNSLLGVASAVVLTVFGVFSNLTDRRVALMIRVESYVDPLVAVGGASRVETAAGVGRQVAEFGASVERLESVVAHFELALSTFAASTRDFTEFNAHLKDNVQRMSLSFGDLSETLKSQVVALKHGNGR